MKQYIIIIFQNKVTRLKKKLFLAYKTNMGNKQDSFSNYFI